MFAAVAATAVVLAGVTASTPGFDLVVAVPGMAALVAACYYWTRWVRSREAARPLMLHAAALVAFVVLFGVATCSDVTMWLRFKASEQAFGELVSNGKPWHRTGLEPWPGDYGYTGLYEVRDYKPLPGGTFEIRLDDNTLGINGFLYAPYDANLPPAGVGDSYRHIGGRWWVMTKPPVFGLFSNLPTW
jgi:hypothetical protein